ncbi:MAG: ferritin-like domain-containing protein [Planctomycetota bacterium]
MVFPSLFKSRSDDAVWRDPARSLRTLESFAATEEDGGKDLLAAAQRTSDPDLRGHLERHAADELRHAEMFRERAGALRAERTHGASASAGEALDRPYDLARGRDGQDAHGFFTAGLYDELGEVAYVGMLHVAEQRAAEMFAEHLGLTAGHDPETAAVFEKILKDEKYHVAYTGTFLEKWRKDGRSAEVERALKNARASRSLSAWKALGLRSAAGFGRVSMWLTYWTIFAPFALLGRRRALSEAGWSAPRETRGSLEGQA